MNNAKHFIWTDAALWLVKIGLWLIPFLPLYISSSMLFPFITGKNFYFRIIVEVISALWVGLAVVRPEYRPKLTPLFKAATVFIAVLFFADLFSPNPHRSFFANYERMEGFMMLFHLYLYLVVILSVFKTRKDWLIFFHSMLTASLMVSLIGLSQRLGLRVSLQGGFRVDATIGNPTYLAAYLLFHIWMLVILIREFWKKWWLVSLYSVALVFEMLILYFTATRGAFLALLAVAVVLFAAVVLFWNKIFLRSILNPAGSSVSSLRWSRGRIASAAVLIALIVIPLFFWQIRHTKFVQDTNVLKRLVNYSLDERTVQSRFLIWRMSAQGFLDRPILGWGQENYYLVFQKYFNPGLYAQEPWFDRSHNLFFDWLIHAGILGLGSFLVMVGAAFFYIFRASRDEKFPRLTGMIVGALFLTHILQNIFVFDNLNTYILFFAFLAYSEWVTRPYLPSGQAALGKESETGRAVGAVTNGTAGFSTALVLLLVVFLLGYFIHVKPMQESKALIGTLQLLQTKGVSVDQIMGAFKQTLDYHTFGDGEVREQMANFARSVAGNSNYSVEDQKKFIAFTAEEFRKELLTPAKDVKLLLFLASILDRSLHIDPLYGQEAEKLLLDAIQLSPTKQILHFELAQLYLSQGRKEDTINVLKRVVELEPNFVQAKVNLLIVASIENRLDIVKEVIDSGINIRVLSEDGLQKIGKIYLSYQLYDKAGPVYLQLVETSPGKSEYRATLAAILGEVGEYDHAIEEARKAAELDSNFAKEAETFIKIMEQKKGGR